MFHHDGSCAVVIVYLQQSQLLVVLTFDFGDSAVNVLNFLFDFLLFELQFSQPIG